MLTSTAYWPNPGAAAMGFAAAQPRAQQLRAFEQLTRVTAQGFPGATEVQGAEIVPAGEADKEEPSAVAGGAAASPDRRSAFGQAAERREVGLP